MYEGVMTDIKTCDGLQIIFQLQLHCIKDLR